jgi:hypothetical protein
MSIGIGATLGAYETTALLRAAQSLSPDGSRFLINTTSVEAVAPPIAVIVNWHPSAAK